MFTPRANHAPNCPFPSDRKPERTCSAILAAVNNPRQSVALVNSCQRDGRCLNHGPKPGTSSGTTLNQIKSCTSNGIFRNISTYQAPILERIELGSVRSTPTAEPMKRAITQLSTERMTVQSAPPKR